MLKKLIAAELDKTGMTYRALGRQIGVSHGVIGYIMADDPPRSTSTLEKFARYFKVDVGDLVGRGGGGHLKEPGAAYQPGPRPSPLADRLLDIAEELDQEEREALLRCAEFLRIGDRQVREHLINQLAIVEDTVRFRQAQAKKGRRRKPPPTSQQRGGVVG